MPDSHPRLKKIGTSKRADRVHHSVDIVHPCLEVGQLVGWNQVRHPEPTPIEQEQPAARPAIWGPAGAGYVIELEDGTREIHSEPLGNKTMTKPSTKPSSEP
jgi:hypothetical protein